MLGLEGEEIHQSNAGWSPVYVEDNLGVMSIGEQPFDCMVLLFRVENSFNPKQSNHSIVLRTTLGSCLLVSSPSYFTI